MYKSLIVALHLKWSWCGYDHRFRDHSHRPFFYGKVFQSDFHCIFSPHWITLGRRVLLTLLYVLMSWKALRLYCEWVHWIRWALTLQVLCFLTKKKRQVWIRALKGTLCYSKQSGLDWEWKTTIFFQQIQQRSSVYLYLGDSGLSAGRQCGEFTYETHKTQWKTTVGSVRSELLCETF